MATRRNSSKAWNDTMEQASDYAREAAARVSTAEDRMEAEMKHLVREVRSQLRQVEFDEATIPDAFRNAPKYISPRAHAWLDVAVTGYFLGLGLWFAIRGKGRAATAAFVNGGMVAGVSAATDYDGDGEKPISFKLHGTLDAVQATTAALGPVLHGFAGEPEAKYFYSQAANEVGVIAMTNWDAGMRGRRRRRRAA